MSDFRVLFVDDEADFLETILKRMQKRGVAASGVDSGEAALTWLQQSPADMVVLDVRMKGMDGIQTLRAIKSAYPLIEVIMLTGNTSVDNAIELMQLGTFDYLMKPINIDDLLYKIEDAYTRKKLNEKQQREVGQ